MRVPPLNHPEQLTLVVFVFLSGVTLEISVKLLLEKKHDSINRNNRRRSMLQTQDLPHCARIFFKRSSTNLEEDETAWLPNWVKGGLF